jgi:hypothetical protein
MQIQGRRTSGTTFIKSLAAGLGLLAAATGAHAECNSYGCYDVYIEELYPEEGGGVWIKTTGNETLVNCTVNSGVYLRLQPSDGMKQMYALLLAAQLADKRVNLRVHGGSDNCIVAYVTLNRNSW